VSQASAPPSLRIPATVAILGNGLRVVAHRDSKVPLVAVHVVYRAGSREEPPGKHGLAHLFEHLMFSGSEHSHENYFAPLERIGAASINANASDDYAAYFAVVPKEALDYALWMEAERMSCLAGALGQDALDRQREIVRNELRQRQAEPYGRVAHLIRRQSYPREHPYAHHPYGSIEDLDNISLDDAVRWFESCYGAASATVVIAGDVEPGDAIEKARRRFEAIPSGPPPQTYSSSPTRPTRETRVQLDDSNAASRIYRVWNVPGLASPERASLEIICELLAGGDSSRLYRRLVREAQLATGISAGFEGRELGSQIVLHVTGAPQARMADLDSALSAELSRFASEIFSHEEIESARARIVSRFIRQTERVCGPHSRSEALAIATLATDDPGDATAHLESMVALDAAALAVSATRWLDCAHLAIVVSAATQARPQPRSFAHQGLPALPAVTALSWPQIARSRLENGLRVMHVERQNGPVELRLIFEIGAVEESPPMSGLTSIAMALMRRMPTRAHGAGIGEELARLGATFLGQAELDGSVIESSMLPDHLANVLLLLGRVVTNPEFEQIDLMQIKSQCTAMVRAELTRPLDLAMRCVPRLIFPHDHPYSRPFNGSGTEAGIASITAERVQNFYSRWLRPNHATLVVVGPFKACALMEMLEGTLGAWQPSPNSCAERTVSATRLSCSRVGLIDRAGIGQAGIFAVLPLPPPTDPDLDALTLVNEVLGGMFSSRLNLALREARGWSYGAHSRMLHARYGGLWTFHALVRSDAAVDAVKEVQRQLRGVVRRQPIEEAELARARDHLVASLPAVHETNRQLSEALENLVLRRMPDNYFAEMVGRLARLRPRDLSRAYRRQLGRAHIAWLIIGDAARIAPRMSSSGVGIPEMMEVTG
jgi:zinc protease